MAYKFIIYGSDSAYWKAVHEDYFLNPETYVFGGSNSSIANKLFKLHFCWSLNKKRELPLKRNWFKWLLPPHEVISTDKLFFICYEASHVSYSQSFLSYIKSVYDNAKICFVFSNPPNDYNMAKLDVVRKYYDIVITYSQDFLKDGWALWDRGSYSKINISSADFGSSDLFFVGSNKGRLNLLVQIYDVIESMGFICDFHIMDVPQKEQIIRPHITYNHYIDYLEVLQRVKKSKCILETLEKGNNYASLRTFEAITYGKKLITTNVHLEESPYYLPDNMLVIRSLEDITREWLAHAVSSYNVDINLFSPVRFLEFLSENY